MNCRRRHLQWYLRSGFYDRRGRRASATANGITTALTYNDAHQPLTESYSGGTLNGLSVQWTYDTSLRRDSITAKNGATVLQTAGLQYDLAGRLGKVFDGNVAATYGYLPDSTLVSTVGLTNGPGTGHGLGVSRTYDAINRLTTISSRPYGTLAPGLPVSFAYQYNTANQRTNVTLEDASFWVYQFDSLGQVISGTRSWANGTPNGTPVSGQSFTYAFDDIGNRDRTGGRASALSDYTANRLNQYTTRTNAGSVDVVGLANAAYTVTVNSTNAARVEEYFHYPLSVPNTSAQYPAVTVAGGAFSETGNVFVPPATEAFGYDTDGNLTSDGRWSYEWDGENRLVRLRSLAGSPAPERRMEMEYDHQGRRIVQRVYNSRLDNTGTLLSSAKFLYDGWNLVAELDAGNAPLRTYVWGNDLSGTAQGAGGVGGLLWLNEPVANSSIPATQFCGYDGNGNVLALVKAADGSVSARYEYGPFGEVIRANGPLAKANPFRFSTKYTDNESGLLYYGRRYYNPSSGRWPSRDPLGEKGALNLYQAFYNNSLGYVDRNGWDNWSNPGAGQNAAPVFIYPPPTSPRDPVNTESKKALKCFVTGQSESFVYGPNDPWTKRMQQHPHMDGVRLRIKSELSKHCAGKGGALSGIDTFDQQQLPAWDKGVWLANDLISWATDGSFGTDPGFRFGSFRLSWRARTPDCCCKTAVVLFHASDVVRLQSGSRHPITGNPSVPVDEPLGPGLPLHNVPINWTWAETIGF